MKHAPWSYSVLGQEVYGWDDEGYKRVICVIACSPEPDGVFGPAIAAMPDLLEACELFVQAWDTAAVALWTEDDVQIFRDAIAKAKGEQL